MNSADVIVSRVRGHIPKAALHKVLLRAKRYARIPQSSGIALAFCSRREIRTLNTRYRQVRRPTDVLSFSYVHGTRGSERSTLGEIIICLSIARAQARHHKSTLADELRLLTVHGLLHIVGYDHQTDSGAAKMRRAENSILGSTLSRL